MFRGFKKVKPIFRKNNCEIMLPQRKTMSSSGYDFHVPATYEGTVINPGEMFKIVTDVKAYMSPNETMLLFIRSSLAIKHQMALATGVSVIDADYYGNPDNDGNIIICVRNEGDMPYTLTANERIAQGVFVKYEATGDMPTEVRSGGIGSTNG